jgi:type IVB pilus formation R64 PilN family outer membrane protein
MQEIVFRQKRPARFWKEKIKDNAMFRKFRFPVIMLALLLLAGCTVDQLAGDMTDKALNRANEARIKADNSVPVVSVSDTPYLMGEPLKAVSKPSPLLEQKVAYHAAKSVSLDEVGAWIQKTIGIPVDTTGLAVAASTAATPASNVGTNAVMPPLPSSLPAMGGNASAQSFAQSLTVDYKGSLSGLLDICANKTESFWKFDDGKIVFYRTETRTFFLPATGIVSSGSGQINTTNSNNSSGSSGGGPGASSGSGNASSTVTGGTIGTGTYKVDMWAELEKAAKVVAGSAQISSNPAIGAITVSGTPAQVKAVENWVKSIADSLGRQIALNINVYSVQMSDEDNYSLDPSVLFTSKQFGLNVSGPGSPAVTSGLNPMKLSASVLSSATGNASKFSNSQLVANALSTLGRTSLTLQQTVVTLNGQPAPVQMANQLTYLASVTPGTSVAATTGTATSTAPSLTPGTITTGFTAMFLPRLVDGKIVLSMNMTNSSLLALTTITSGQGVNQASIQAPNVDISTFQQSVTLTPGDSLLLTGLSRNTGNQQKSGTISPLNWLAGGGIDNTTGRQLIAIVITAKVI